MILKLEVEQTHMDAFARLVDAALKGAGVAVLPDASAWMAIMQDAVKAAQEPAQPDDTGRAEPTSSPDILRG